MMKKTPEELEAEILKLLECKNYSSNLHSSEQPNAAQREAAKLMVEEENQELRVDVRQVYSAHGIPNFKQLIAEENAAFDSVCQGVASDLDDLIIEKEIKEARRLYFKKDK